jgi:hypothetical protein
MINLGTFWLKIEWFWPFEEFFIFSNGGHLGYRTALTDTTLKGDHPRALRSRWPPQPNLASHRTLWEIHIKIFSSETTEPVATKLLWKKIFMGISHRVLC